MKKKKIGGFGFPHPTTSALPKHSVRESSRAKHVNLRVLASGELQVVVPVGFDRHLIPDILRQKRHWIDKTTQRVQQAAAQRGAAKVPPTTINLVAVASTWQVDYALSDRPGYASFSEPEPGRLLIQADVVHSDLWQRALQKWLTLQGKHYLIPWLKQVSVQVGLPFQRASVRGQKTLWGSCSQKKAISLNYKLLFLPRHLVRYVFVHELCHTRYMNHSPSFWALVSEKMPDYEQCESELRSSMQHVPPWANRC